MNRLILILPILICQMSFGQVFDVDTLFQSGPIDKRINLVVLSDGYQAGELDQFIEDSDSFIVALFAEPPYQEYRDYFNVFAIKSSFQ